MSYAKPLLSAGLLTWGTDLKYLDTVAKDKNGEVEIKLFDTAPVLTYIDGSVMPWGCFASTLDKKEGIIQENYC